METHTGVETAEAAAVESLPDVSGSEEAVAENNQSFMDALEANLDQINQPEPEATAEPEGSVETPEAEVQPSSEEAPPEEIDPLEELSPDAKDWTPSAGEAFKKLKGTNKELKTQLTDLAQREAEYKAKIEELTGLTENKDIEALQRQVEDYENEKTLRALEETSAYQEAVTKPLEAIMGTIESLSTKYGVNSNQLIDAVNMSDPQEQEEKIAELLPDAGDRDKATIYGLSDKLAPIIEKENNLKANRDEALNEAKLLDEQKVAQEAAEKANIRKQATRNVAERIKTKVPNITQIDGVDLDAMQEKAANLDPNVVNPVDYAFNAIAGQLLPKLVMALNREAKEKDSLIEQIATFKGAEPDLGGTAPSTGVEKVSSKTSFTDALEASIRSHS